MRQSNDRRLIVGGTIAEKGRYPYFVSVGPFCGGALIASDVVLTVGHCVPHRNPTTMDIRIGAYSLETDQRHINFETLPILQAFRHPRYERLGEDEFRFDFALFFLNGTSTHPPVSINQNPDVALPNKTVIAMGFGNTKRDEESRSNVLRQVSLTTISNNECRSAGAGKKRSYENRVHVDHQCTTGGPHNKRDACAYDSGGPIIIQKTDEQADDETSKDLLVGLVSWGEGCANPIYPAVNARVSSASQWIEEMVCSTSISPPGGFCNLSFIEEAARSGPVAGRTIWTVALVVALGLWSLRRYRRRRQNHDHYDPVN